MNRLPLALLVLVSSTVAHRARAQAQCNHTTKTVAIVAGDHNFSTTPCASLRMSIAGSTVSGPTQCTRGGAHYAGTVYQCGGQAQNIDCKAQGYKVDITTYSDGGCPDLTGLIPGATFASWAAVPQAVRNGLRCVPPKKKNTFDWSAATSACPTGRKVRPTVGQVYQGAGSSFYVVAEGPPYSTPGAANPFLTAYDTAQATTPAVVQGTLGSLILPLHPRLAGARMQGEVTFEHHLGGVSETRTLTIDGSVLSNGRFDVSSSCAVPYQGKQFAYGRRLTFDGNALTQVSDDSENGNVWDAGLTGFEGQFTREVPELVPMFAWVRDPFDIPWFESIEYTEVVKNGVTKIQRSFDPGIGNGIETEYELDTAGPVTHPVATRVYDLEGDLRLQTTYSNHVALTPGVWRPMKIVRTLWLAPSDGNDRIVVTLMLSDAAVLTSDEQAAVPKACADEQLWFHWL